MTTELMGGQGFDGISKSKGSKYDWGVLLGVQKYWAIYFKLRKTTHLFIAYF